MTLKYINSIADILESTAGTTCDDSLLYIETSVMDLVCKLELYITCKLLTSVLLTLMKDILKICIEFLDCVSVAWMEWKCDHRTNL